MFTTDTDLLPIDPRVFTDVLLPNQRVARATDAALEGATVTSASAAFGAVEPGHVALLGASDAELSPYAVEAVPDSSTLTLASAPVGLPAEGLTLEVRTFRPQREQVHERLMRAIGIDADDPAQELDESAVVSVTVMRRLESLGTLAGVYEAAVSLLADDDAAHERAAHFRRRFHAALLGSTILLDTTGDGRPDAWRAPAVANLIRT